MTEPICKKTVIIWGRRDDVMSAALSAVHVAKQTGCAAFGKAFNPVEMDAATARADEDYEESVEQFVDEGPRTMKGIATLLSGTKVCSGCISKHAANEINAMVRGVRDRGWIPNGTPDEHWTVCEDCDDLCYDPPDEN